MKEACDRYLRILNERINMLLDKECERKQMITLRDMNHEDLTIFTKWLCMPHVAEWYKDPDDWISEVRQQDERFSWVHHYIVEIENKQIGFCQYYACSDSDEEWEGYTMLGSSYSIDYMIGDSEYLKQGFGKEIVSELIKKIKLHSDAKRIVVQPEVGNDASRGLLKACGFSYDMEKDIFILEFIS